MPVLTAMLKMLPKRQSGERKGATGIQVVAVDTSSITALYMLNSPCSMVEAFPFTNESTFRNHDRRSGPDPFLENPGRIVMDKATNIT